MSLPLLSLVGRTFFLKIAYNTDMTIQLPAQDIYVHKLFSSVAAHSPETKAVHVGDAAITYSQLDAQSSKLARLLRQKGVKAESRVALYLDRSLELMVAIVGSFKSGGAYVPLDVEAPIDRIEWILGDCGADIVLTLEKHRDFLAGINGDFEVVTLDSDWESSIVKEGSDASEGDSFTQSPAAEESDRLAYIIYTSGSTGRPKGVMITHDNLAASTRARFVRYGSPPERILFPFSFTFDPSIGSLWWALVSGGTVYLPEPDHAADAAYLFDLIEKHRITHLVSLPTLYQMILDSGDVALLQSLVVVILGGEVFPTELVKSHYDSIGHAALHNEYGPTETTVWASSYLTQPDDAKRDFVPIGTAAGHVNLYVLDDERKPVKGLEPGTLWIGGVGVARGYLNRDEETVQAFQSDVVPEDDWLHNTGDLVRYDEGGNLVFLGRTDDQVKIRGQRIALSEIEHTVMEMPGVTRAVVLQKRIGTADHLIVYVESRSNGGVSEREVKAWLISRLPVAMIPALIMVLDKLPSLASGKVDRQALSSRFLPESDKEPVSPRNEVEQFIWDAWAEVLGIDDFGVHDSFFFLGGHSLIATQVVARIREKYSADLSIRDVFRVPTIAEFALLIAESNENAEGIATTGTIDRLPRNEKRELVAPASFAQRSMWLSHQYNPDGTDYNLPLSLRLSGDLNLDAFRTALEGIVQRHEAFRTTFRDADGQPVQEVTPRVESIEIDIFDLKQTSPEHRQVAVEDLICKQSARTFDLEWGPLYRFSIIRLGPKEHIFSVVIHHVIGDQWSFGVLLRDLEVLYAEAAATGGNYEPLKPLAIQPADFAVWEQNSAGKNAFRRQREYWKAALKDLEVLSLPTDYTRPAHQSLSGNRLYADFPAELYESVESVSARLGVTPYMTLLGAFKVLLSRYSGQTNFAVGAPSAGRTHLLTESLIGMFVNTLVLRTRLEGDPSFYELLTRVRETTSQAYANQDVPFEQVVEDLGQKRTTSHAPLVQVLFNAQNAPVVLPSFSGIEVELLSYDAGSGATPFDLVFNINSTAGQRIEIVYTTDLFSDTTIETLIEDYLGLVRQIVANPMLPVSEYKIGAYDSISDVAGPDTYTDIEPVHVQVERVAAENPGAIAVVVDGASITYGELIERSKRLAHVLREHGVKSGSRVALYFDRSIDLVVGVLSALRIGAAYVPLSVKAPQERLRWTVNDSDITVALSSSPWADNFPPGICPLIVIDDEILSDADGEIEAGLSSDLDLLAYVIYTSGSTGRPKGVMVSHRSLTASTQARLELYSDPLERMLLPLELTFDAAVGSFWWTLVEGGTLVLPSSDSSTDASYLFKLISSLQVTHMVVIPTIYDLILEEFRGEGLSSLKFVAVGGEVLPPALIGKHYRAAPDTLLYNEYGPTEATVWASTYLTRPEDVDRDSVPIGKAVGHVELYVLDELQRPVADGERGELWIGGVGVAEGYLNNSAQTEAHFVPDRRNPARILYRTGDLVSVGQDGNLIFFGRGDSQVNINGVRIELGEVEHVLLEMSGVARAAVIVRETASQHAQLFAFVEPYSDVNLEGSVIRDNLQDKLLPAMMPNHVVVMKQLPQLSNGKVDRAALASTSVDAEPVRRILPRGGVEQTLWDIWAAILKHKDFGVRDDFFMLGGHSLLATQMVSRIRDVLQANVLLRDVFDSPTIEKIAQLIRDVKGDGSQLVVEDPIPTLPRTEGQPLIAPVSFSQARMWMVQQMNPAGTAYNMGFALRFRGGVDTDALAGALNAVVSRHEAFRTRFAVVNGEVVQVIAPAAEEVAIRIVELSHIAQHEKLDAAVGILREDSLKPFRLDSGPLHRPTLVRMNDDDSVFLWLIHHSISDQWSVGVMLDELSQYYNAIKKGQVVDLGKLEVEYSDFSRWQRSYFAGGALETQLEYWKNTLKDIEVLTLPLDKPRPTHQSFRGGEVLIDLGDAFIERLNHWSAQRGVTAYMTLLSTFHLLLARYSGQQTVAVGSPIANRTRVETESLVGTLVNTLVMKADLHDKQTFDELLSQVRENTLNAYAHQDLSFDKLVDAMDVPRDTSYSPLVQVLFNVVNAPMDVRPFDGLAAEFFHFDGGAVQFDLSCSVDLNVRKMIHLGYATDLFEHSTAQRFLDSYMTLLYQVLDSPAKKISEYELLSEKDRQKILVEWNDSKRDYPLDKRVDELIASHTLLKPEAIAVSMGEKTLSYDDLNRRSNQLGNYLARRQIGAGSVVGICLERSIEMVVSMLAVVKSGAAYVPMDPAFPKERIDLMASSAGLDAVITQTSLLSIVPERDHERAVVLDVVADEIAQESSNTLPARGTPEDPAYILYTSGSTGTPKGVVIPHRALTNFLCSMRDEPGFSEKDVLLSITTLSFDISELEIYLPLISGGRVDLATQEEAMDGRKLVDRIAKSRPDVLQATPATWRMLIDSGWQGDKDLRILCGGEPLSAELATALLERCGELWNMYGPTETTVWSTVERILPHEGGESQLISIGRPIANTTVYILDKFRQPVPVGVPGELYIGGEGVALGYHKRPDLTGEVFMDNPFTGVAGDRIYKTGDLARWLPDGRMVHLGRTDFQVKIRGFRIELGEIESVLLKYPDLGQVVVAAKRGSDGLDQLVAYVIAADGLSEDARPSVSQLREHVRKFLPAYMVPAHFVFMDEFPLTANNKVNVKALPEPQYDAVAGEGRSQVEPRDTLELQLLLLWRQALGTEAVGVEDNFFEFGGHSLMAVQLLSHINKMIGKELPLATLFEAPSVAQMIDLLRRDDWKPSWRSLVAINPAGDHTPIFAVPGVGGNVLMFAQLARLMGAKRPFYGLQARGLDGVTEPFTVIEDAARHNIEEIRTVNPHGPYILLGVCTGGVIAFEMARQLQMEGEKVSLIMSDTWPPCAYSRSRVPQWLRDRWSPINFWIGRASGAWDVMRNRPLSDWPGFVKAKLSRARSIVVKEEGEFVLEDTAYYRERMTEATIDAIIDYEIRQYDGALLHIAASERDVKPSADTRQLWQTYTAEPSRQEYLPSIDSGQMFVSPHVENLAAIIEDWERSGR